MALLGWIVERAADYAVAHPPSSPEALEHARVLKLSVEISRAALGQAASSADDETAVATLRGDVSEGGAAVREAIKYLGDPRDNFLYDRAYRLLTAAVDGGPVRPIDPTIGDLFLAEERLGRLPLRDAFAYLAQTEPRLLDVEREISERRSEFLMDSSQDEMIRVVLNRIERLVGFSARDNGWLMRSDLTQAVVFRYLLAVAGARNEDAMLSLFQRPGSCNRTILLWGLKRPAASN